MGMVLAGGRARAQAAAGNPPDGGFGGDGGAVPPDVAIEIAGLLAASRAPPVRGRARAETGSGAGDETGSSGAEREVAARSGGPCFVPVVFIPNQTEVMNVVLLTPAVQRTSITVLNLPAIYIWLSLLLFNFSLINEIQITGISHCPVSVPLMFLRSSKL